MSVSCHPQPYQSKCSTYIGTAFVIMIAKPRYTEQSVGMAIT